MTTVALDLPVRSEDAAPDAPFVPALLAALAALAVYAVTLSGTYVYDDWFIANEDERVRDPSFWWAIWTAGYFPEAPDNLYRPLVSMTYALQWWLHGDWPELLHLVNWLLHAAVSATVAELGRRTIGFRAGLIAGVLFAVQPVHVEVVAGIVGRAELMCTLGLTLMLVLYVRRPMTTGRALGVWACALVALLSKEQGLLAPLLLLAASALLRMRPGTEDGASPAHRRGSLLLVLLICWTFAGYIVWREVLLDLSFTWERVFLEWTKNPMILARGADEWLMPFALLGRYATLLVAPTELSPDYGGLAIGWRTGLHDPYLIAGLAVAVIGAASLIIALVRRNHVVAFLLIGLALTYGLVSNFGLIIGTNFGELLMYLPSVFFLLIAGAALARWRGNVAVVAALVALTVGLYSIRTVTYALRWNDPVRLYTNAIGYTPGAINLYLLLAEEQMRRGDTDAAMHTLELGRDVLPNNASMWAHSARTAERFGLYAEALAFLDRAKQIDPRFVNERIEQRIRDSLAKERSASTSPPPSVTTSPAQ